MSGPTILTHWIAIIEWTISNWTVKGVLCLFKLHRVGWFTLGWIFLGMIFSLLVTFLHFVLSTFFSVWNASQIKLLNSVECWKFNNHLPRTNPPTRVIVRKKDKESKKDFWLLKVSFYLAVIHIRSQPVKKTQ